VCSLVPLPGQPWKSGQELNLLVPPLRRSCP
jgi:hypothetical protein